MLRGVLIRGLARLRVLSLPFLVCWGGGVSCVAYRAQLGRVGGSRWGWVLQIKFPCHTVHVHIGPMPVVAQLSSQQMAGNQQLAKWRVTLGIKVCRIIPKHAQTEGAKGRYRCAIKSRHNLERFRASPAWSVPEKEPPWPTMSDLAPRTNLCMCEGVCVCARAGACVGARLRGCACMCTYLHIGRLLR